MSALRFDGNALHINHGVDTLIASVDLSAVVEALADGAGHGLILLLTELVESGLLEANRTQTMLEALGLVEQDWCKTHNSTWALGEDRCYSWWFQHRLDGCVRGKVWRTTPNG